MTPKVTVLLAVHDGEPYVHEAVRGVLEQTLPDFEFLVVDDASTDNTVAIVNSFADPRIRILRNEHNLGQVPSLNRGLLEARGEYVARIDADDVSLPRRLERQVALLDAQPEVALVGAWMSLVDDKGRLITRLTARMEDRPRFVLDTLTMRVLIAHPAAMYRREAVVALDGYDESTGPAEDKDLWRRLLLAGWDARIVPELLIIYRLHDAQLSQTQAAYQREVDGRSQERFLSELAIGAPVHRVRLMLAGDAGFWADDESLRGTLTSLDRVMEGARHRLLNGDADRARLDGLVAEHVLRFARTRPWSADARALRTWALARLSAEQRHRAALRHRLALVLAPPTRIVQVASRRAAAAADRIPPLRSLRAPAKRSRIARRLYTKLVGGG